MKVGDRIARRADGGHLKTHQSLRTFQFGGAHQRTRRARESDRKRQGAGHVQIIYSELHTPYTMEPGFCGRYSWYLKSAVFYCRNIPDARYFEKDLRCLH